MASLAIAAALLAGCGGSPAPSSSHAADATATATTGVIRGVVVDAAVHPLAGAHVAVSVPGAGTMKANTTASGTFAFSNLPPGTYFVSATKLGFSGAQTSVDVHAGVNDPPVTRLQLVADPSAAPYYTSYQFRGYIECSTSVLAACSGPNVAIQITNLITCTAANQTGTPTCTSQGNVTNDKFLTAETVDKLPDLVQSELVWDPTNQVSDYMTLVHSYTGKDHIGTQGDIASNTSMSPVFLRNGPKDYAKVELGNKTDLLIRVFASGDPNQALGLGGAAAEQEFIVYTHIFYGYKPPADWRFSRDGDPPFPT